MFKELSDILDGDIETSEAALTSHSRDASLLMVRPSAVVFPAGSTDIQKLVQWVNKNKDTHPEFSLTARAAGTCMAGGSLNESIIVDTTRHMNRLVRIEGEQAITQPGLYYRDFEKSTLETGYIMPAFTASKDLCAVGGMFGNNSGGEKTLRFGKVEDHVIATKTILADGQEYVVVPLGQSELSAKMTQGDFEGECYRQLFELLEENKELIQSAKPKVSKNSAGYYLWNVWNRDAGIFDLNKLLVGSQGTLGITTEITWKLVPAPTREKMLVLFLDDLNQLGDVVNEVLAFEPDSLESYDDASMKLAVRFFPDFFRQLGFWPALKLGMRFLPEVWMLLRGGIPKLVLIAEFTGTDESELTRKVNLLQDKTRHFGYQTRIPRSDADERKYWKIRHESFNLLRKHVSGKRTAPFIDDIIVRPEFLPEFLPKMQEILARYDLTYTIAGHAGNGNFHIIPLMDMSNSKNKNIIDEVSDQVYDLVLSYEGSITAEHNDGIIRTPYLEKMYGSEMYSLFKKVKAIFDPKGIFNPGKKVGGTKQYMLDHLVKKN